VFVFDQADVASLQLRITAAGLEDVHVRQLVFTAFGSLNDASHIAAGSIRLFHDDGSAPGAWDPSDTLIQGGRTFLADNGAVTFLDLVTILTVQPGVPEDLLLVFDLDGPGSNQFANLLDLGSLAAVGALSGRLPVFSGGAVGNLHQVLAPTPTPTPYPGVVLFWTHSLPSGNVLVRGATGVPVMDFAATAGPSAPSSLRVHSVVFDLQDGSGNPVPANAAFSALRFTMQGETYTQGVSAVTDSSVTLVLPASAGFALAPGASGTAALSADVAAQATASQVRVVLAGAASLSVSEEAPPNTPAVILATGDPTGFPMVSTLFAFVGADLSESFGNHPNPFRAGAEATTFEFYVFPASSRASLEVYDVFGSLVRRVLPETTLSRGTQRAVWDGRNGLGTVVIDGIYYARLVLDGRSQVLKVAVVK
jgi:hypothetical protein